MRFRGGGVGHVSTPIEDPEAPEGATPMELDVDTEVSAGTSMAGCEGDGEEDGGDGNEGEGDESDPDGKPSDEEEGEDEQATNGDDDDDVEGLGTEQVERRLRESIIEDLGYSDL